MRLTIHDANQQKVGWIDNDKQETLNFYGDLWRRQRKTGSSVFEFTVTKKALQTDVGTDRLYTALNERGFVSFKYKGRTFMFTVMRTEETESTIYCYCEYLNLELLNEMAQPYESAVPMSFVDYCKAMDLLNYTMLTIGINEVASEKLALTFDQQETKLARLLNLVSAFGAENEFETQLKPDSTVKKFLLNVYKAHDSEHQGVGTRRDDLVLKYGNGLRGITRTVSKENLYTMVVPVGKRSDVTKSKRTTVTNPDGTKTITDKVSNSDNSYTTTTTIVDRDGKVLSTKKVVATKNSDGTITKNTTSNASGSTVTAKTSSSVVTNPDKSTTKTTTTVKSDGTTEKTTVHTKTEQLANKTTRTTVTTTKPDGTITQKVTTKYSNGTSNSETKTIKQGSSSKSTTTSKVDSASDEQFDLSDFKDWSKKNAKGELEFYKRGVAIYAPLAAQLYPAAFTSDTMADQWIRYDVEFEADSEEELNAKALEWLEARCYPSVTYEVDGYLDGEPGDTIRVEDSKFSKTLLLSARIEEQQISFTNPSQNKTTIENAQAIESKVSSGIQQRLDTLLEEAKPYTIKLATDNGVAFKNGQGQSVITPTLYRGGKPITTDVTWRWTIGEVVKTGMTYTVNATDVIDTLIIKIAAYIIGDEVATSEITFTNVTDGPKGDKGASVQSVKVLNKPSGTNVPDKTGTFTETKPNPTKTQPYIVSYVQSELSDGTVIESNPIVSEVRNPEFDAIAQEIVSARQYLGTQLQSTNSQLSQQAKDLLAQAQAQTDLTKRVTTVEDTANGTKTTVTELSKTVDGHTGQISSVSQRTKTVEDGLSGLTTRFENLSVTATSTQQEWAEYKQSATENYANLTQRLQTTDGKLSEAQTLINQTAQQLTTKANQSSLDRLTGRVSTAETKITQTANSLTQEITATRSMIPTDISSQNLLRGTKDMIKKGNTPKDDWYLEGAVLTDEVIDGYPFVFKKWTSGAKTSPSIEIAVKAGVEYTFTAYIARENAGRLYFYLYDTWDYHITSATRRETIIPNIGPEIQRFKITFIPTRDGKIRPRFAMLASEAGWFMTGGYKLNRGSIASDWSPASEDLTTVTDFNRVEELVNSHTQTIGSVGASGTILDNLSRVTQTANLIQSEVFGTNGLKTQMSQLAGSWAVRNLTSAGTVLNQINLQANGVNRIDGRLTHITGQTLIDDAVIKSAMIANLDANKITGGILAATNGATSFNLNTGQFEVYADTSTIRRVSDSQSQFIKMAYQNGTTLTTIGANRTANDEGIGTADFTGLQFRSRSIASGGLIDEADLWADSFYMSGGGNQADGVHFKNGQWFRPMSSGRLYLGMNDRRWREVHSNEYYINGVILSTYLKAIRNCFAQLMNGGANQATYEYIKGQYSNVLGKLP